MRRIVLLSTVLLLLTGCSSEPELQETHTHIDENGIIAVHEGAEHALTPQLGFLTLSGEGLASHPFSEEAEIAIQWKGAPADWTALPVWITGTLVNNTITDAVMSEYPYEIGTTDKADAYYEIITKGWQEGFEDLWCEVYDKFNDVTEWSDIDATLIADILSEIHGQEKYGTLQDTLTDALMLIKDANESGPTEELNTEAGRIYNDFYRWLYSFSVDDL